MTDLDSRAWLSEVAGLLGRKLSKIEKEDLAEFFDLYIRSRQDGSIDYWSLDEILPEFSYLKWAPQRAPKAAFESPTAMLLYLDTCLRWLERPRPDLLVELSENPVTSELIAAFHRGLEIQRWQGILESTGSDFRSRTDLPEVDLRLVLEPSKARFLCKHHAQAGFEMLKPNPLRRLTRHWQNGEINFTPAANILWQTLSHYWDFSGYSYPLSYDLPGFSRLIASLLRFPNAREFIVTPSGNPFVWRETPLNWTLFTPDDEHGNYELFLSSEGQRLDEPVFLVAHGSPSFYVTPTSIWHGPAVGSAAELLDGNDVLSIPAPALETPAGARLIKSLQLDLPPRIQSRIKTAEWKIQITCALIAAKPPLKERLRITGQATLPETKRRLQFTAHGWGPEFSRPGIQSDYLIDESPLVIAARLFDDLGLTWDHFDRSMQLKISRNFPEKFAAWLSSIPREFDVRLEGELACFGEPAAEARIRLDCTEADLDWFDIRVILDVSQTDLTQEEIRLLLANRGKYVRLPNRGWKRLNFNLSEEDDQQLAGLGISPHELSDEPQRIHALQLAHASDSALIAERQMAAIRKRASQLKARVNPDVPASIQASLRPYQVDGYHFLAYLAANRFGGILADDMGLGKTLQTLTWLAWLRETEPEAVAKPSLVVCPKSVTDNWKSEAERFLPGLRVRTVAGTSGEALAQAAREADLCVVNYAQMRGLDPSIRERSWFAAILDEAQMIKNPNSQTARIACALDARHRLVLSGTPIENRLMDLWSLMAFCMPGILGNRHAFERRFNQNSDPLARRRLSARVRPFLLRRTKSQVATELPDRIEEDLHCELEGVQKTMYMAELKFAQRLLLGIKSREDLDRQRFNFLASLLRLRQICCDPRLLQPDLAETDSAKVAALVDLLEPLMDQGHKVLVFSQFTTLLDLLSPMLESRGWPRFQLTGSTENRGELVQRFQQTEGSATFLISLKAGGFGLNLTAASYVILFDPWWNPAVENQAIDRTHRIGQTNHVIAYRLLAKGTVEEKIRQMQKNKAALAQDVLGEETFARGLTLEDLKFLFSEPAEP